MDHKMKIKIVVVTFFLLLFIGAGSYFFTSLNTRGKAAGINLFSLVPSDCSAIFETNDLASLLKELKGKNYGKELTTHGFSLIAKDLIDHFDELTASAPSGLSLRINKMLISFHSPGTEMDQVLYFPTNPGDEKWIEEKIQKKRPIDFPLKSVLYKDKKINICPMGGDLFLCYYKSSGFVAVSYSKRLIEQVIDAHVSGNSVLTDKVFGFAKDTKTANGIASLYVKEKQTGWSYLNLKFDDDAISLSGITTDAETSSSFVNAIKEQSPIKLFSGNIFPSSTYYMNQMSILQIQYIAINSAQTEYDLASYSDEVKATDIQLMYFLKGNVAGSLAGFSFCSDDSIQRPFSLLCIPMQNSMKAEADLRLFMQNHSINTVSAAGGKIQLFNTGNRSYRFYSLPPSTIFSQLSGIKDADLNTYALFYKDKLLLAPDPVSALSYINQIEKGNIIEKDSIYKENISHVDNRFNFLLMTDLGKLALYPEYRSRLIPDFFCQHMSFFSHFILLNQLVCQDRKVYPNLIFIYKDEK